jgi:hypothetical protein
VADTLNLNAIDSMYFSKRKTDTSYVILGCAIGIPLFLFFGGLFLLPKIDSKH